VARETHQAESQNHRTCKHCHVEGNFDIEQPIHVEADMHVQAIVDPPIPRKPNKSDEQLPLSHRAPSRRSRIADHPNTANATANPKASASIAEITM
jgi:hypothetical protein